MLMLAAAGLGRHPSPHLQHSSLCPACRPPLRRLLRPPLPSSPLPAAPAVPLPPAQVRAGWVGCCHTCTHKAMHSVLRNAVHAHQARCRGGAAPLVQQHANSVTVLLAAPVHCSDTCLLCLPCTATAVATAIAKASATAIAEAGNKCCPTQAQAIANALAIDKQVGRSELGQGDLCLHSSLRRAAPSLSALQPTARHSAANITSLTLLCQYNLTDRHAALAALLLLMLPPDRHSHRLGGRRCLRQRRRQRQRILHCHCHGCGEPRAAAACASCGGNWGVRGRGDGRIISRRELWLLATASALTDLSAPSAALPSPAAASSLPCQAEATASAYADAFAKIKSCSQAQAGGTSGAQTGELWCGVACVRLAAGERSPYVLLGGISGAPACQCKLTALINEMLQSRCAVLRCGHSLPSPAASPVLLCLQARAKPKARAQPKARGRLRARARRRARAAARTSRSVSAL